MAITILDLNSLYLNCTHIYNLSSIHVMIKHTATKYKFDKSSYLIKSKPQQFIQQTISLEFLVFP
jgi:hypothetical protein